MVNMGSLKQGYLYIKRERSSSPVATRILFKPWQQAYFILRANPYILEEYKDASLKTQRQIHFIGTVKHVGSVRTSKSKQYAFEIVMSETTHLLLACDNEILLQEWIDSFTDVMTDLHGLQLERKISGSQASVCGVERTATVTDKYEVDVIDTALSEANDLHGEYLLYLSATRFLLTEICNGAEVLSWPFTHVTSYQNHVALKRVVFTMGRNCHFGCGKLTFETHDHERLISFIKLNIPIKKANLSSSSFTTTNSETDSVFPSLSTNESMSFDENKPVFDSPLGERKPSTTTYDMKDITEENNNILNLTSHQNDVLETCEIDSVRSNKERRQTVNGTNVEFAAITNEESYVLPNEDEINDEWRRTHSNFTRFSIGRSPLLRSRENSDEKTEQTTTYLQLTEEDDVVLPRTSPTMESNMVNTMSHYQDHHHHHQNDDDDNDDDVDNDMKRILQTITSSLENPTCNTQQHVLTQFYPKSKSTGSSIHEKPEKLAPEHRRASEPWSKTLNSPSPKTKLRQMRATMSQDSATPPIAEHPSKIQSPSVTPRLFKVREEAFPKQHSVTQKTHGMGHFKPSTNPFGKAEAFFTRPMPQSLSFTTLPSTQVKPLQQGGVFGGMKRDLTAPCLSNRTPDLDRKRKPKTSSVTEPHLETIVSELSIDTTDEPPPIPERISPPSLKSPILHHKLRRTDTTEIHEDDPNLTSTESSRRNSAEDTPQIPTVSSAVEEESLLTPPPLPPKAKVLSSTRSAPLNSSIDDVSSKVAPIPRRRSYGNFEDSAKDSMGTILLDQPPEIPSRVPVLSSRHNKSTGNLLEVQSSIIHHATPPRTPTRTPPKTPPRKVSPEPITQDMLSQSLDSTLLINGLLSVKITNYEEEIVRTKRSVTLTEFDASGTGKVLGLLPKSLTHSSGKLFPDSPQRFF